MKKKRKKIKFSKKHNISSFHHIVSSKIEFVKICSFPQNCKSWHVFIIAFLTSLSKLGYIYLGGSKTKRKGNQTRTFFKTAEISCFLEIFEIRDFLNRIS